jgi:hypothetical protein
MNNTHINKLSSILDHNLWQNPERTIQVCLDSQKGFDFFNPDTMKKSILRTGTELSKEEKKNNQINPAAKVYTGIFDHFTPQGLYQCVQLATDLALELSAIQAETDKIATWLKRGIKKVKFSPAPDCCDICKKLRGSYKIQEVPIAVLDTHLGCRCSISIDADSF